MIDPGDLFFLPDDFKPYVTQIIFFLLFADHHELWASHKKLASVLGFSVRTVIRTVARLEKLGILSVKRLQGGEVNRYSLDQDVLSSFLAECASGPRSHKGRLVQDSSSTASDTPLEPLEVPPETSRDVAGASAPLSLQAPAQDTARDGAGNDEKAPTVLVAGPLDEANECSEPFFDDPHLGLLVAQVEQGRKDGTRLHRWLKAENLLTYWPPDDTYRVDKQLLRQKVKTLEQLNALLTAPVRAEHKWFVNEFLQCCAENDYQAEDTSGVLSFEINLLLDSMLRPGYRGKALWTTESIRAQIKMIIEQWRELATWSQLRLAINHSSEPTLQFLVTNKAVWEAARERWNEENDAKIMQVLERMESGNAGTVAR